MHSIYRWKGRVCDDGEYLLLVKTTGQAFAAVRQTIQEINTYELPEILAYRVDEASDAFASWIAKTTLHARKAPQAKKKAAVRKKAAPRGAAAS